MPTAMITEEQWQKLKPILLDLNIYDKPSLKETFLGIIYRLKTGCPWRYLPSCYGKANTYLKHLDGGLLRGCFIGYSKG